MRIAFIGDLAFFGKNSLEYNPSAADYFKPVANLLKDFDYVVGNLETPFVSDQKPYAPKSAHIKSSIQNVELLKLLNIDLVTLANNHVYDFGQGSLDLTCNTLKEHGIEFIGINDKEFDLDLDCNKLSFHGYCCYSTHPIGMDKGVNVLDIGTVENRLDAKNKAGYFCILNLHFGQEHVHTPNYDHVEMCRQFSDNYKCLIVGHHPHVIQGIEEYNGNYIAYSLGNLCFDDVYSKAMKDPIFTMSEFNKKSFIWDVTIEKNKVIRQEAIPIYLGDKALELGNKKILEELDSYSKELQKPKEQYVAERSTYLSSFFKNRIKSNNFMWFITRLRYDTYKRYKKAKNNKALYKKYITNKLNNTV